MIVPKYHTTETIIKIKLSIFFDQDANNKSTNVTMQEFKPNNKRNLPKPNDNKNNSAKFHRQTWKPQSPANQAHSLVKHSLMQTSECLSNKM